VKSLTKRPLLVLSISIFSLTLTHCGSDDDSNSETTTTDTGNGSEEEVTEANILASAYPGALALSVFPDTSTSNLRLQEKDTEKSQSYAEKLEDARKRLKGEADCFESRFLQEPTQSQGNVTCYNFDSDMNPSEFAGDNQTWGTTDGTDGNGQACMVTFAKAEVDEIVFKVDRALAMVQGLLCAAKKAAVADGSTLALPTADDTTGLNLKTAMESELADKTSKITMDSAVMTAYNASNGTTGYQTQISFTNPLGTTDTIILRHVPAETDDGTESGVLTFKRSPSGEEPDNIDPNQSHLKYDVMSINYERDRSGDTDQVVAELRSAMIHQDYEPIDDSGLVAYDNVPDQAANGDIHAIKYVAFDMSPETGAGNLSYWMNPGGNVNESARGFLFKIEASDDDVLKGCGISGATRDVSIRGSLADTTGEKVLKPVRYWHPRWSDNISTDKNARYDAQEGNKITEQCFTQDSSVGKYVIDTSKTTSDEGYDVKEGSDVAPPKRPDAPPAPAD
jgi:hypothetical protein